MMDMDTIYISGKMTGLTKHDMDSWRSDLADQIERELYMYARIVNPINYYNTIDSHTYDTDKEYVRWELRQAKNCKVIVVGWNKEQDSLGTMAEMTYAYANNIPIILYLYDTDSNEVDFFDIHPFVLHMSDKIFCADEKKKLIKYLEKYIFLV